MWTVGHKGMPDKQPVGQVGPLGVVCNAVKEFFRTRNDMLHTSKNPIRMTMKHVFPRYVLLLQELIDDCFIFRIHR